SRPRGPARRARIPRAGRPLAAARAAPWRPRRIASSRIAGDGRSPDPMRLIALAGGDLPSEHVAAPRRGASVGGAVGAERIPGAVEVEPVPSVRIGDERDEAPRRISPLAVRPVAEEDLELGLLTVPAWHPEDAGPHALAGHRHHHAARLRGLDLDAVHAEDALGRGAFRWRERPHEYQRGL